MPGLSGCAARGTDGARGVDEMSAGMRMARKARAAGPERKEEKQRPLAVAPAPPSACLASPAR